MIEFERDTDTDRVRIMRDGEWIDSLVRLNRAVKWIRYGRADDLTESEAGAVNSKLEQLNNTK